MLLHLPLVIGLELRLVGREKRSVGVVNKVEDEIRVSAIPERIEFLEGFDASVENAVTSLLVHIFWCVARHAGDYLNLVFSEKLRDPLVARFVQDRGIEPIHNPAGLVETPHGRDESAKVRDHLRSSARQIEKRYAGSLKPLENLIHRFPGHDFLPGRACVHVAVDAGQVTELPDVDLKDFGLRAAQGMIRFDESSVEVVLRFGKDHAVRFIGGICSFDAVRGGTLLLLRASVQARKTTKDNSPKLFLGNVSSRHRVAERVMNCSHQNIVDSLVTSYHEVGGINRIDSANLPSKRTITDTCEKLLQLLFPGFHDEESIPAEELEMMTSERIATLVETLEIEVAKTLRLRDDEKGEHHEGLTKVAHDLVCEFLRGLPDLRRLLQTDVEAAYEGDPAAKGFDEIILAYPCIEAIAIQRCAHCLYELDVPLIPRIMTEYAHRLTGIDIHPGAKIGTHFFIDHGTGVVIGETCVIGNHVKLYHGVTLGARNFPKDESGRIVKGNKRHPNVEDHVVIYPHATVLGGKTVIGEGSTIGANVFLMESIPRVSFVTTVGEELNIFNKETGAAVPRTGPQED